MQPQSTESGAGALSGLRPLARRDLRLQEVGTEGLLYDREGGMVHILNSTALYVWRCCDGERTPEAIAAKMRETFAGTEPVDIGRDVLQILSSFAERGLLEPAHRT